MSLISFFPIVHPKQTSMKEEAFEGDRQQEAKTAANGLENSLEQCHPLESSVMMKMLYMFTVQNGTQ